MINRNKRQEITRSPSDMRDKIGYMFGDFGNDFTFIFASSFLMVFYTKVLGISGLAWVPFFWWQDAWMR